MNPYENIFKQLATELIDSYGEVKPNFTNAAFIDATLIFQTLLMDKLFDNQNYDKMDIEHRMKMAETCGIELRKLIHTFTGLDTFKLVEDYAK